MAYEPKTRLDRAKWEYILWPLRLTAEWWANRDTVPVEKELEEQIRRFDSTNIKHYMKLTDEDYQKFCDWFRESCRSVMKALQPITKDLYAYARYAGL